MDASLPGGRSGPGADPAAPNDRSVPPGPPFDLDVLADLHAGVFPDEVAAVLRARVAADPPSAAVLAALDSTVAGLRALPPVPIPRQVAARLEEAIAAESVARARAAGAGSPTGPGVEGPGAVPVSQGLGSQVPAAAPPRQQPAPRTPPTASPRQTPSPPQTPSPHTPPGPLSGTAGGTVTRLDSTRGRTGSRRTSGPSPSQSTPRRWATGLAIAAAVAAVFTIGAVVINPGGTPGSGLAGDLATVTSGATDTSTGGAPTRSEQPPANAGAAPATTGRTHAVIAEPHHLTDLLPEIAGNAPAGPFADQGRLDACLAANDATGDEVLGVLKVSYTGQPAYAISVRTDDDTVRVLVVGPDCGAAGADLMEEQTTPG